ncbi:MAG TPA: MFS transporter [Streptosporangiaceae bacterium]|nr:MFS transporter [Streptosporangiaceae bacterium]
MNPASQATDRRAPSTFAAGVAIAIIVTCQLMVVLDSTVVNIALPQMREALGFSHAGLSWVINAYTLTFGGLMLLGGRAGDIFGRRRLLVLGLIVFSVASLVGGLSVSPAMLVTARAVQGVGAAMAAPSTLALIAATFGEGPARNRALSIFSGVSAGAGSLGLILGGVLVSGASWRWVLFINVPIGLVVVLLAPRFVPEPPSHEGRLDLAGGLLSTAGLALLIYGFIWIAEGGSNAAIMAGLFAAAAILLALFVTVEARRSSPVMPLGLVLDRTRGPVYLALLSISAAVFAMLFFISQFAQNDLHYSALRTGLAFLPLTIAIFVFSRIMPSVLARTGPRIPLLCGPALMAASMAWLSQVSPSQGYLDGLLGPFLLFGIGAGVSYVPMSATILSGVDRSETGAASGLYQAMQQIGGSVGLAVLVTVAASHGRPAALEGAAGFAALAVVLAAVATIRRAGPSASAPQPRSPEPVGRREH